MRWLAPRRRAATPDVCSARHARVLAEHLPRPLWGKLIAACLAAPRTDARLVVDTIGVPALCEHIPGTIIWTIVSDIATRAMGKGLVASPPPAALTATVTAPIVATATASASGPVPARRNERPVPVAVRYRVRAVPVPG